MNSDRHPPESISSLVFPRRGRRAVLLCDGPQPPRAILAHWLREADLFVCTDGAGLPYEALPRSPDLVIGDFDTLGKPPPAGGVGPRFVHLREQDSTDSEKALLRLIDEGCEEAVLLGATGARLDHSLHNVNLLARFAGRLRLCLADEHMVALRLGAGEKLSWDLPAGLLFSLLPLGGPAEGVSLSGARYPLRGAVIEVGGPAAVSNRVDAPPLGIMIEAGQLLVSVEMTSTGYDGEIRKR